MDTIMVKENHKEGYASGNVTNHGQTQDSYDAGIPRIAKGTITSWSCNTSSNGFTLTASYTLSQVGRVAALTPKIIA